MPHTDVPSVLVERLTGEASECTSGSETCLELSLGQYNGVASIYNWAAALAAVFTGILLDRFGSTVLLWISGFLLFAGPLIFATGAYPMSMTAAFGLLLTGRLLTGLGFGAVIVITHRMKGNWFGHKELALSFGVQIFLGRLGSATCFLLLGGLVQDIGLKDSLWLAFALNTVAGLCAIALVYVNQLGSGEAKKSEEEGGASRFSDVWKMVKKFDAVFWWFVCAPFFYYGTVATFSANEPNYLAMRAGFSEATSSFVTGIIYDIGILSPLFGWLLDKYGYRQHWLNAASLLLFLGLLLLFVVPQAPPAAFIAIIGLGYSAFSPLVWSSMMVIVPQHATGFATGAGKFTQFVGMGALTLGAGAILDARNSMGNVPWDSFFIYLICMSGAVLLLSFVVCYLNWKGTGSMTPSQKEREEHDDINEGENTPLNDDTGGKGETGKTDSDKSSSVSSPSSKRSYGSRTYAKQDEPFKYWEAPKNENVHEL